MTTPNVQLRRATLDDLAKLQEIWTRDNLPLETLEKRFKEFQVVDDGKGTVLGAIGFEIIGSEGRLHNECFADPAQADELRARLLERAQIQAKNHGLVRIWSQLSAPFWSSNGLQPAQDEALSKLPEPFKGDSSPWLCQQLRDDKAPEISIDKEFMIFREAVKESTQRIFRQAKILNLIAVLKAVALVIVVMVWAVFFLGVESRAGSTMQLGRCGV
jgi:N-acetylglutamate synthase-like GNAT family acetyltransferase